MRLPHNLSVAVALSIGIIIAAVLPSLPLPWLLAGLILITAGIIRQLYQKNLGWLLLCCCLVGGGFRFGMARAVYLNQCLINQGFDNQEVLVDGIICSRPEPTRAGWWFVLRIRTHPPEGPALPQGRVSVFCQEAPADDWYGRKVSLRGRFKASDSQQAGFPGFLEIHHLTGSISATGLPRLQPGFGLIPPVIWADQVRQRLTRFGRSVLEPSNARLLHGIIFGDPLDDSEERFLTNLQRTSTIHLLSVSGMHVGFVAVSLSLLLGLLKLPQEWRIGPLTAGVWFYIMMTGMDPPALRAGIMLTVVLIGNFLRSADLPLNRLSLAAIILLMLNPYNLFDLSFQLSFAATFGVSCLYPLLDEYFPINRRCLRFWWRALLVSLSAQLMITPFLIQYFQLVSWVAPLANILLVFPGEAAVIGGLAGEALGNFLPYLGGLLLTCIDQLLNLMRAFINWLGSFSWAALWSPQWPWPWLAGYYLGLALLIDSLRPNLLERKQRQFKTAPVCIGILLFLNLIIWGLYCQQLRSDYLQVVFLDVGQGDAILIRGPKGKSALIDGGDLGRGRRVILPYLQKNGISRLEWVFLTHYHQDHWGGLIEVLRKIPVKAIMLPPSRGTSNLRFAAEINSIPLARRRVQRGMVFQLGRGASLEILDVPDLATENDRSVVMLLSYGKIRLLLTGDLSFPGEELLLRKSPHRLQAALLKVGHHGSNSATGLRFLSQIKPGLAVISVGAENRYGHPGPATINRLRSLGAKIFTTDTRGIIDCRIYQDRILIRTSKNSQRRAKRYWADTRRELSFLTPLLSEDGRFAAPASGIDFNN